MISHLTLAVQIAQEAGGILLDCYRRGVACRAKGSFDVVTEADHLAEALILRMLDEAVPDHAVLTEEAGSARDGHACRWYIDPMDGTKNFSHGHPFFCTMLAMERDGELELAVVHDPIRHETFRAERGGGVFCNDQPVHVSGVRTPAGALVTSGYPSSKRHQGAPAQVFLDITMRCQALRRTGCSGLDFAYVACGRFDAVWDWGLEPWDIAPGLLLVREGGGVCTDWQGDPYCIGGEGVVAANPELHASLLPLLREHSIFQSRNEPESEGRFQCGVSLKPGSDSNAG